MLSGRSDQHFASVQRKQWACIGGLRTSVWPIKSAQPDHINPISISRWYDFPNEDRGGENYPIFALAYAWLTDADGGPGATIQDMKAMFRYMAEGDSFHDDFEENFFSLMEAYLG